MNDVVREFLAESQENLAQLDLDLVSLEKEPTDRDTLTRVFRTLHTFKGTAGFLGLLKLQTVAHAAENLLDPMMDGELTPSTEIIGGLLATVDAIRRMLAGIERTGKEGDTIYTLLLEQLASLRAGAAEVPSPIANLRNAVTPPAPLAIEPFGQETPEEQFPDGLLVNVPQMTAPAHAIATQPRSELAAAEAAASWAPAVGPKSEAARNTIRVDVRLLDELMGLIGELVLTRNQVMPHCQILDHGEFASGMQRFNHLTNSLQSGVMKTRMQPIGSLWGIFPRVVRDMAAACGKQARLDMEGSDTELDKAILEAIRDPLTHIIRNSIDHGIENPATRLERHKPVEGRLTLHANQEGGKVVITIADDGQGIDPQRVKQKAILARLITPERAELMSERSLLNLIFMPGFSTAEKVSQYSGRGVGMNVVRSNIERIGGTVAIESRLGRGTTLNIKIPLTLAIIPALLVVSGGSYFAIPQLALVELIQLEADAARHIEQIRGAQLFRSRGKLLPLVRLNEMLQIKTAPAQACGAGRQECRPQECVNIVVVQADDRQFGLIVDEIHEISDTVVKPLQRHLRGVKVYAGATMKGDGMIAMILDVLGLARQARIVSSVRARVVGEQCDAANEAAGRELNLVVCAGPDERRLALPLSRLAQLEELSRSALEWMGKQVVVQRRGRILPLIDVIDALGETSRSRPSLAQMMDRPSMPDDLHDFIQVAVYDDGKQSVGLYGGDVVDIVTETVGATMPGDGPLVQFSCVVQGRVTEVLDVEAVIRQANSTRMLAHAAPAPEN